MDRKAFYDAVRPKIGALTQANVEGFERYLDEGWRRNTALDRLAYIIATVFWETGRTMQPVKEAFYLGARAEAFRRKLRYFPWYGRGDIQLTWEENYLKAGKAIGVDLIKNPEAALDPKNAVKIAFEGMEGGWFTGKSVNDYLDGIDESDDEDLREFANARRVVNGTDKQIEIGQLALNFENALRLAGYSTGHVVTAAPVAVPASRPAAEAPAPATIGHNGGPAMGPAPAPVVTGGPTSKATGGAVGAGLPNVLLLLAVKLQIIPPEVASDPETLLLLTAVLTAAGGWLGSYLAPKNAATPA